MMTPRSFVSGLFALLVAAASARGATTIVSDFYNVPGTGTGFTLNSGVNTGINPPTTRLGGTAASSLRYLHTGTKSVDAYSITNNQLLVTAMANPGRFVLSADGVTSYNFGPVLGVAGANPTNTVVYEVAVRMNNSSAGTQRFSFAIGTSEGDANSWDFGLQIYRTNSANNFYTIGKRVDSSSSGLVSDLNEPITSLTGNSYGEDLIVVLRVTDAGAETTAFNSRVQLSLNGGNSWIYDTAADPDLPNGWRFDGIERHIMWDVAPNAGPATYDSFALQLDPLASNVNNSPTFKAVAYNIHFATLFQKVNTHKIANFILDENADLVALNEVDRFKDRSNDRDLIGELAKQTGMHYVFSNVTGTAGGAQSGNAILSKYPILARENIFLPRVGDNEQRALLKTVVDTGGKFISFWATHLDFRADHTERLMCVTNFNTWVDEQTLPVVIAGDFNDTPDQPMHARMELKWQDAWLLAGDGTLGRTVPCPGPPLNARIDYIWKAKSARLVATNAHVNYTVEASDHYPVVSQFVITNFTQFAPGFFFPLDKGTGRAIDSIGGLSSALGTNGPIWSIESPSGQPGDHSLYFDGTRSLSIIDPNQIVGTNGVNGDYTIQAWIRLPLNYAPSERAVLFQYERRPGFSISINPDRTLHTALFGTRNNVGSGAAIPNDGQWHHVAVVHTDQTDVKFFIDAKLVATVVHANGAGFRTSATITVGSSETGSNRFTGHLSRIGFENRALVPQQFDFPAVPSLGLRENESDLTIFWPAGRMSYVMQVNSSLSTSGWMDVPAQLVDGEYRATATPNTSARFYRLRRQQ